jgi:hypothetical protein
MYESTDGNGDGEDATVVICEPLVPGCTTSQLTCIADKASCCKFDSEYPSEQQKNKRRSRDWEARRQQGDNHGENGNDDGGDSDGDDSNDDNNNSSGNRSNDNEKGNGNNDQSSDDDRPSGDAGNSIPKTSGKPIRGKGQFKSFRFKQVKKLMFPREPVAHSRSRSPPQPLRHGNATLYKSWVERRVALLEVVLELCARTVV